MVGIQCCFHKALFGCHHTLFSILFLVMVKWEYSFTSQEISEAVCIVNLQSVSSFFMASQLIWMSSEVLKNCVQKCYLIHQKCCQFCNSYWMGIMEWNHILQLWKSSERLQLPGASVAKAAKSLNSYLVIKKCTSHVVLEYFWKLNVLPTPEESCCWNSLEGCKVRSKEKKKKKKYWKK